MVALARTNLGQDFATQASPQPLGFGVRMTSHMVTMRWTKSGGWQGGEVEDYHHLDLDPAAVGLHYGQVIFEGLKAYRQSDGGVAIFRPRENARRFNRSAERLVMPALPEEDFVAALRALVAADRDWVPSGAGQSLYLRPYMIASEATLGVRPASEYLFVLIASPVDPFFSSEVRPVNVWVSDTYVRAAPGGTGAAKTPGNYAGAMRAQMEAAAAGCDQVVWLDAVERLWVEEMGAMNLFFVWDRAGDSPHITTPPLTGTLLPGVVRDSLLALANDAGYTCHEEQLSIADWRSASHSGTMTEAFATGTAAVVAPIGTVRRGDDLWTVGAPGVHPVALDLRQRLLDLQHGVTADPYGWLDHVA